LSGEEAGRLSSVEEVRSIDEVQQRMREQLYIADRSLATSIFLALKLGKPLFLEGEAGVGKTEIAKVLAAMLGRRLIRLQCYEGLDVNTAVYEWDYTRQMLQIRIMEAAGGVHEERAVQELFSPRFLLKRPLLQAIEPQDGRMPVLLIDELDRCVAADTLIATTDGFRRAEEVRPEDVLISFDPDAFVLQRSRVKKVIPRRAHTLIRLIAGGHFLEITPEHKFVRFGKTGYQVVPASVLQLGDKLPICETFPDPAPAESDRQVVLSEVTHIELVTGEWTVYDFVLDGEPYFVANQVVTHNCDEEFEAFLLEILSDFQITIPEIGTIRAEEPPVVVITSNRTREIHDALKRRCLYHWIDYPSFEKEYQIVLAKVPEAPERLAREVVAFVQELRREDLYKLPGIAETLDWMAALVALDQEDLTEEIVNDTLGVLLKYQDDIRHVKGAVVERLLARAEQAAHER